MDLRGYVWKLVVVLTLIAVTTVSTACPHDIRMKAEDMRAADLSQNDLLWRNWINADLHGAILREAHVHESVLLAADLGHVDGTDARFEQLDLRYAKFVGATLVNTSFVADNLSHSDFRWADLSGATFSNTSLYHTDLRGVVLSAQQREYARSHGAILDD